MISPCHRIYTNRPNWNKKQRAFLDKIHCWQNPPCQIFDLFQLCTNMVRFSVTQDNASTNANICASCKAVCSVRPCQQHSDILTSYVAPPSLHTSCISDIYRLKKITPRILSERPLTPISTVPIWSLHTLVLCNLSSISSRGSSAQDQPPDQVKLSQISHLVLVHRHLRTFERRES